MYRKIEFMDYDNIWDGDHIPSEVFQKASEISIYNPQLNILDKTLKIDFSKSGIFEGVSTKNEYVW